MLLNLIRFVERYKLPLFAGTFLLWEVTRALKVARGATFAARFEHLCTHPECAQIREKLGSRSNELWRLLRVTAESGESDNPPDHPYEGGR